MSRSSQAPGPAIARLSLYLRQLEAVGAEGVETVSSRKLGQSLGLNDTQVRKDLAHFGQFGRSGVGYEVTPLIRRLRKILGTDRVSTALLVGAGDFGRAVAAYPGFRSKGFELVAAFDSDPGKAGKYVAHLPVQPMTELHEAASLHGARLAIVAVPPDAAQNVADQLVASGVLGILNIGPAGLNTPPGTAVHDLDLAAELERLNYLVKMAADTHDQKEVLIVDDSEASVVFLSAIVEDTGHRFRVARNGKDATARMKERRPDLVLLDLMMPRKSGITVFQEMKGDPDLRHVPVIIITGASEVTGVNLRTGEEAPKTTYEDDVARRFGVVLYETLRGLAPEGLIEKPIDPGLLSGRIKGLLS